MDFYCHTVTSMPENLAKSTGARMPQMAKLCSPFARAKLHNMLEILLFFLGSKLQKMNVSINIYCSCQINLMDFSLQSKFLEYCKWITQ